MLSRRLLRIKVVKALFAHLKSGADNMMASEKTLMASVDKAYDLYFQILILPVEIARYAEQRQELAKQKKLPTFEDLNPNTKFVDNAQSEIRYLNPVSVDVKKKKYCRFKKLGIKYVDYKDGEFLKKFLNEQGKILPRRLTGTSQKFQKKVAQAVKRARHLAILPFVTDCMK